MNVLKISLCAAVATAAMAGASAAFADDAPAAAPTGLQVAYNIGAATDYIFRGIDQTGTSSEGEAFGGVDLTDGKFYAGTWVSNTGPRSANGFEYDLYGGYKPNLGPVTFDLGFYFYGYNTSNDKLVSAGANTLEWKAGASMPLGGFTVGAVAYYSSNENGTDHSSWYEEGDVSYTFKNKASVSAAIGGFQSDGLQTGGIGPETYMTWNVGVTYPVTDKLSFDLRYIGTNSNAKDVFGDSAFDGGVATLKVSF